MIRHLFIVASLLSLLLSIATVALWLRSFQHADFLEMGTGSKTARPLVHRRSLIYSCGGELGFTREWTQFRSSFSLAEKYFRRGCRVDSEPAGCAMALISPHGFRYQHLTDTNAPQLALADRFDIVQVSIPHWLAALITAGLSWAGYRAARSRAPVRPANACRYCGYDLRASKARCPECGTPVPSGARATA